MSEVVGDIQAMTATALHILPNTSSGGGDHTSNSCARGGVDVRVTEDHAAAIGRCERVRARQMCIASRAPCADPFIFFSARIAEKSWSFRRCQHKAINAFGETFPTSQRRCASESVSSRAALSNEHGCPVGTRALHTAGGRSIPCLRFHAPAMHRLERSSVACQSHPHIDARAVSVRDDRGGTSCPQPTLFRRLQPNLEYNGANLRAPLAGARRWG